MKIPPLLTEYTRIGILFSFATFATICCTENSLNSEIVNAKYYISNNNIHAATTPPQNSIEGIWQSNCIDQGGKSLLASIEITKKELVKVITEYGKKNCEDIRKQTITNYSYSIANSNKAISHVDLKIRQVKLIDNKGIQKLSSQLQSDKIYSIIMQDKDGLKIGEASLGKTGNSAETRHSKLSPLLKRSKTHQGNKA